MTISKICIFKIFKGALNGDEPDKNLLVKLLEALRRDDLHICGFNTWNVAEIDDESTHPIDGVPIVAKVKGRPWLGRIVYCEGAKVFVAGPIVQPIDGLFWIYVPNH